MEDVIQLYFNGFSLDNSITTNIEILKEKLEEKKRYYNWIIKTIDELNNYTFDVSIADYYLAYVQNDDKKEELLEKRKIDESKIKLLSSRTDIMVLETLRLKFEEKNINLLNEQNDAVSFTNWKICGSHINTYLQSIKTEGLAILKQILELETLKSSSK